MGALDGVRVLDLAGGIAGGYAGKLLADLGADVLLVEPPAGDSCRYLGPYAADSTDRERSGLHLYLHAGKRSVVAGLASEAGRALVARLLPDADVLLTAQQPEALAAAGLDPDGLREACPRLVHISLTAYGASGPYRHWHSDEITDYAMGGWLGFGGEPERGPLMIPGGQAQHHGGMQAALAVLVALHERERSGLGQFVDISTVEAMLSAHSWLSVAWSHTGQIMARTATDLVRCADGWVYFMPANLDRTFLLIEQPELLDDPRFSTLQARMQHRPELQAIVAEWCKDRTMEEIYRTGQELRVAVTPVHTVRDLDRAAQLAARDWWVEREHPRAGRVRLPGVPYCLSDTPAQVSHPAPALDEHGAAVRATGWGTEYTARPAPGPVSTVGGSELPLAGVRVLEITANWAGPLAARYLADLGADVIKVEAPARPATRGMYWPGNDPRARPYNRSGYFNKLNRNKRGLVLDLAHPRGRELFLDLARSTDIVIENNSARVMGNLGLDYAALCTVKPDMIMCSMSGFGATGPERDYVAYGSNIETVSGLAALMTYPGDPTPHRTGSYYADPVAGGHGVIAILAALRHRERTGRGQWIDLSLLESAAALFGEALMTWTMTGQLPAPRGNRHPQHAPQGTYPCAGNDSWLALTVRAEEDWQALCRTMGRGDLESRSDLATAAGRHAAHDELDTAIAAWSRSLDHYEAARHLQAAGIAAAPVLSNYELLSDPHLTARGFYTPVPHPEVGTLPFPGMPWRFSRTPGTVRRGAPCFGEHNRAIFTEELGLSEQAIAELYDAGITADEPLVQLTG